MDSLIFSMVDLSLAESESRTGRRKRANKNVSEAVCEEMFYTK